mmetsp:Transcript_37674/g.77399  ORF Transcript_37674/g.77399 Transcript_37674/m.77399 type:complete len:147 (-) Transcript_37674:347-787(-)
MPTIAATPNNIVGSESLVLDLGCGSGMDMCLFAKAGATCIGIDLTEAMVTRAQETLSICQIEKARARVFQARVDSAELPLELEKVSGIKPSSFDIVMSNGVFNLCTNKRQAFKNAFDMLKPGGIFALCDMMREPSSSCGGGGSWAD